ncbi:MAG: restriction endonuclease subunit S [Gammaproteobacteria bacterium]|nr:restriction endonuclease subunit S [Gammaproteobacteria bacterium]
MDKIYYAKTYATINNIGIQNSSAVIYQKGMVVMTRDAGVGKSAITTETMAVSQHFMAWRCGAKMDNHFLYYWLQFKKRMFENIAMGSTIVTIGLPYFKRLKISAPIDLGEQVVIGGKLKSIDTYIFGLKDNYQKLTYQKSGLMHDLLTGKVPVTIDDGVTNDYQE